MTSLFYIFDCNMYNSNVMLLFPETCKCFPEYITEIKYLKQTTCISELSLKDCTQEMC